MAELDPEKALFHDLNGIAVTFYENERPLRGLVGLLDWRFHGAISNHLRSGAVSGRAGECVYLPIHSSGGKIYHLILLGGGNAGEPGARKKVSGEALQALKKNISSLKLEKIGISRQDFGGALPDGIEKWPVQVLK